MQGYTGTNINYFRGVCERLFYGGAGDFMISPGDIDPPESVYNDLKKYIGSNYLWYPVTGNHEAETTCDMNWFHAKLTKGAKSAKGFSISLIYSLSY